MRTKCIAGRFEQPERIRTTDKYLMKRNEIYEIKWNEMNQNEMKRDEMEWNELKQNEIKKDFKLKCNDILLSQNWQNCNYTTLPITIHLYPQTSLPQNMWKHRETVSVCQRPVPKYYQVLKTKISNVYQFQTVFSCSFHIVQHYKEGNITTIVKDGCKQWCNLTLSRLPKTSRNYHR